MSFQTRIILTIAALLILAAPASEAAIITACGRVCEEVTVLVPPPPSLGPDPGWDAFVGSAEEKLAAQLADLLHEPAPEWTTLLVCTTPPGKQPPLPPLPPWMPQPQPQPMPPHGPVPPDGTPEGPTAVPEPLSLLLGGVALLAGARRLRRRT